MEQINEPVKPLLLFWNSAIMKTYLVGGAVRDKLLGLPVNERDWVVVGSSREEMLAKGFKSVGKDFPVYLHPETGEEYALARTERKTGPGHKGFEFDTSLSVSLEEDLKRRDLTINAIAEDKSQHLIDPFGGRQDIEKRILRHVSEAFAEDPLRVLRAARFATRFHRLGFSIEQNTLELLSSMVKQGLLAELAPERIWGEINKALAEKDCYVFFEILAQVGAVDGSVPGTLFPGIGRDQIEILKLTAAKHSAPEHRFALFLGTAPSKNVRQICKQLKAPKNHADIAQLVADNLKKWKDISNMDAKVLVEFIYQLDGIRRKQRLADLNNLCRSIVSIHDPENATRNHGILDHAQQLALGVDRRWLELGALNPERKGLEGTAREGKALGDAIKKARIEEVAGFLDSLKDGQTRQKQ